MQVRVDVQDLGIDMLTIVGHKFGAPKGVAALYIRKGVPLGSFFLGGGQVSFALHVGTASLQDRRHCRQAEDPTTSVVYCVWLLPVCTAAQPLCLVVK